MSVLDTLHDWLVAKSGSDVKTGHPSAYPLALNNDAKLTIGAVISAPPLDGDTIRIWPGTYAENPVIAKKVRFVGKHRDGVIIQPSVSATALTISSGGEGTVVEEMTLKSHASGARIGLWVQVKDVVAKRCWIWGNQDGVYTTGTGEYLRLEKCWVECPWDAVQIGSCHYARIDECILLTTADYVTANPTRMGALCGGATKSAFITNSFLLGIPSGGEPNACPTCVEIKGQAVFDKCVFILDLIAYSGNEGTFAAVVRSSEAACPAMNLTFINCTFCIVGGPSAGTVYLAYVTEGKMRFVNCNFINTTPQATLITSTVTAQVVGQEKDEFIDTNDPPASWPDDTPNNWWLEFTTGNNAGEARQILDWVTADDHFYFSTAFTNDIQVGDQYKLYRYKVEELHQGGTGEIRVENCTYDRSSCSGTIIEGSELAAKILKNKAVQTKATGVITYYDDDGVTPLLTHTPTDAEASITRTPS